MIKPIMRDVFFLMQKSAPCTKEDLGIAKDLRDTLAAHRDRCVGMAANMIGVKKCAIIVNMDMFDVVMFNPVITKKEKPYPTEEGCLSLEGTRATLRFDQIEVEYMDEKWKKQKKQYSGWIAQIIQHEVDHCNGVII